VAIDGTLRYEQARFDLLVAQAFRDQAGDLYTLQVMLVLTPLRLLHGHHSSALTTQQLQPLA
jgi:hypothetical protein